MKPNAAGIITVLMTEAEAADTLKPLPGETKGKGGLWIVEKDGLYYNNTTKQHVQWATTPALASTFARRHWAERIAARFGGAVAEYEKPRRPGRPAGTGTKGGPITFRPEQEDQDALAVLRERNPGRSDSDLIREALRQAASQVR